FHSYSCPAKHLTLPLSICIYSCKINLFYDCILRTECTFCFGDLADHSMITFNGLSGVNDSSYSWRVCKEPAESIPVGMPAFKDHGILASPLFFCLLEIMQAHLSVHSFVDLLQIF